MQKIINERSFIFNLASLLTEVNESLLKPPAKFSILTSIKEFAMNILRRQHIQLEECHGFDSQNKIRFENASEWKTLKSYVKEHKQEAYFLKYLVKVAGKSSKVEIERFQTLFKSMQANLFFNPGFLPDEAASFRAEGYIKADKKIRDFDLIIFWKNVRTQNLELNFPEYNDAEAIRKYIKTNPDKIAKVTHIHMLGIFEAWAGWAKKYGQELGLPYFETEKAMHDYLENSQNVSVIRQMVVKENAAILEKTTRLPAEAGSFTGLKTLVFSNRKSWVVPKSIYQLKALTELCFDHSELRKVSKLIGELKKTNIRFIGTQLTVLPATIRQLDLSRVIIVDKKIERPLETLIKA